jgi:hypothetical protein
MPGLSVASDAPIRVVPASETLTVAPAAPLLGAIPVTDGVVLIRRDIALPVDHLREPAEVVVDVLGLIGDRECWHRCTEHQRTGDNQQVLLRTPSASSQVFHHRLQLTCASVPTPYSAHASRPKSSLPLFFSLTSDLNGSFLPLQWLEIGVVPPGLPKTDPDVPQTYA